ncbi:MAG: C10 family peptidase [Bacteroidetes bacterium]|nr:C10 family peptidase [Bacteroidota bacterium]
MKTKNLFTGICFIFSISLFAGNVTLQQAKKVALNFYYEKYNRFEGVVVYDQLSIRPIHVQSDGIQNFYYVLQVNNAGFIIVPADDCLAPVLGYSFKHNFVAENQPPNVRWWFQQYEEQVRYAREKQMSPEKRIIDKWTHYLNENFGSMKITAGGKEVEPLLTTEWDQGFPENYYCPEDPAGPGGHALTGCVATAVSQIAYYWRWPDHGRGYTSYLPKTYPEYGVQSADFENTWYRYNEMVDKLPVVNTAVAEYMYHVAVNFHMDFSPYGSAPDSSMLIPEYDSTAYHFKFLPYIWLYRDSMPDEQWKALLVEMIDDACPIYYGGNYEYSPGHAFVCDGYLDEELFHFNFGWGGISNGYYTIDNIQGFNYHQDIRSTLCPDTLQFNYPLYETGADTLGALEGSISDGSGPIHNYLNNTQVSWLIDPQNEQDSVTNIEIIVKRLDLFNDGDRLYIYDGEDNSAPLLAELSGNTIPNDIESTGNKVFVEFITDGSNTAPGFYLNYKTTRPVWCSGMTQLTGQAATFDDGSGSFFYHNSKTCTWMIDPGVTDPLTLHFNYFDTEEINDVVKIYDGVSAELIAEISGYYEDPPGPVTSPSGKMKLAFLTNNSIRAQGWEAWYDINTGIPENAFDFDFMIIPNPVTSNIKVSFNLQSEEQVSIQIFDIVGQKLEFMVNETLAPGFHSINGNLDYLTEGLYFCRLQVGEKVVTKKFIKL